VALSFVVLLILTGAKNVMATFCIEFATQITSYFMLYYRRYQSRQSRKIVTVVAPCRTPPLCTTVIAAIDFTIHPTICISFNNVMVGSSQW
jgi:hypothetical protein